MSLFLYHVGLPLTIAISLIAIVALWIGLTPVLQRRRRRSLWRRAFPARWDEILREDRMRVTISAQACLLLLNRRGADYFPELRQILVYPDAFVVERMRADAIGLQYHAAQVLTGESWSRGQVVLSWQAAQEGGRDLSDGRNVVIHEFAHQLDQEFGPANGAPLLSKREDYAKWSEVLGSEYAKLQESLARGEPTLLDPYGATDPAEFFACSTELFYEKPMDLAIHHPALYNELRRFYCVDPLRWNAARITP
jgi:Mlc titration factor MtfA (ptsG expression regulator)